MSSVKGSLLLVIPAALAFSGCATHGYVTKEVGEVNKKVDTLGTEVEKTQERVQRNETRIDEVNNSSQSGINEAKGSAQQAMTKADAAERAAKGKLVYAVTLSNDKVTFPLNRAEISPEAKKIIEDATSELKTENKGVYFEIEGHTDSTGPEEFNHKLGEDRAMAVRNYLHDELGIALNRMQVISYGSSKPVVDNKTPADRAQNRRVVIKVLE
ncbi:MAG TPA: OmpA family protein [Vicinamibacteria bacterium]|jgi:peptidoglycan-associated lipoprotein|nr:OmpA family protein [Vicinamibacteria bacterium]